MPILANTHQTENLRRFSETGENKKIIVISYLLVVVFKNLCHSVKLLKQE